MKNYYFFVKKNESGEIVCVSGIASTDFNHERLFDKDEVGQLKLIVKNILLEEVSDEVYIYQRALRTLDGKPEPEVVRLRQRIKPDWI